MRRDPMRLNEQSGLYLPQHEPVLWRCHLRLVKKWGPWDDRETPYEVIEDEGNLLTNSGARALWDMLTGLASHTAFSNANANIKVGDNANADVTAAATDTTIATAGANRDTLAMDASFPANNGANGIDFRGTAATGVGNYKWLEWAVSNYTGYAAASGVTVLLNHKGYTNASGGLGTKTSAASWQLTVTLSLS
jgi:hypothetical protein